MLHFDAGVVNWNHHTLEVLLVELGNHVFIDFDDPQQQILEQVFVEPRKHGESGHLV